VDKAILAELNLTEGKNSWQNRKAALESIIAACERAGHYLEGNKQTLEVIKSLKMRLNDTQANLKPIAALALGHIVASLDTDSVSNHNFLQLGCDEITKWTFVCRLVRCLRQLSVACSWDSGTTKSRCEML
jgi:hypothetical protein